MYALHVNISLSYAVYVEMFPSGTCEACPGNAVVSALAPHQCGMASALTSHQCGLRFELVWSSSPDTTLSGQALAENGDRPMWWRFT